MYQAGRALHRGATSSVCAPFLNCGRYGSYRRAATSSGWVAVAETQDSRSSRSPRRSHIRSQLVIGHSPLARGKILFQSLSSTPRNSLPDHIPTKPPQRPSCAEHHHVHTHDHKYEKSGSCGHSHHMHELDAAGFRREGLRVAAATALCGAAWMDLPLPGELSSTWWALGAVGLSYPIYFDAIQSIRHKHMTMGLSMTIGVGAALSIGETMSAAMIATVALLSELLEGLAVTKSRGAVKDLVDLPITAWTLDENSGEFVERLLTDVKIHDQVLVRPGGAVPVDGVVVNGESYVNQLNITGEVLPVHTQTGGKVFAGTINETNPLTIRTTQIGHNTTFGQVVAVVEKAEQDPAPVMRVTDELAKYVVGFAFGAALATYAYIGDVNYSISCIVVAGACGLAAGTPLAVIGAIGMAANQGVVIKSGSDLQALSSVDTLVFDKTGTLTKGEPVVIEVETHADYSKDEVLGLAALVESKSEHPLGRAIVKAAETARLSSGSIANSDATTGWLTVPGLGVVCTLDGKEIVIGKRALLESRGIRVGDNVAVTPSELGESSLPVMTNVYIASEGSTIGRLGIADDLRDDVAETIGRLREIGYTTVLLTGDSRTVAAAVGQKLQFDKVEAELLPEDKAAKIHELRQHGRKVAMVGDGINDAPAMIAADVGISMGSGASLSHHASGVILMGDNLGGLIQAISISRKCRNIVVQNLVGTVAVDVLGVGFAFFGKLPPVLAAAVHGVWDLAFIFNSARLLRLKYTTRSQKN